MGMRKSKRAIAGVSPNNTMMNASIYRKHNEETVRGKKNARARVKQTEKNRRSGVVIRRQALVG